MLTIRLQRTGKKNQADFRIVIAEKEAPVNKKILEVLGSYNPRKKLFRVKSDERLKYWLSQKVEVSPTVHNLFVTNKVLEGTKVKSFSIPKKPEKSDTSADAKALADKSEKTEKPAEAAATAENTATPAEAVKAEEKKE
jgi:small subunit ribosomal protein S16